MDGDRARFAKLLRSANEHDAWLMTDDAHGLGVVGDGRGSNAAPDGDLPVPLADGNTVESRRGLRRLSLRESRGRQSPAQSRAKLDLHDRIAARDCRRSHRRARDHRIDTQLTHRPLELAGVSQQVRAPDAESPIVPIMLETADRALAASEKLVDAGFLVVPIRPPTVPEGTADFAVRSRLRIASEDVDRFAAAVNHSRGTMSRVFITASGTEIGKTFVTCALIHQLRSLDTESRR